MEIIDYRNRHYNSNGQQYLVVHRNSACLPGDEIDSRSHHFWAEERDSIVGVVRATTSPFELESLAPREQVTSGNFSRYLELGRLVVSSNSDKADVSSRLLAAACLFGIDAERDGLVAICRAAQRRLFERLGMQAVASTHFTIPSRGNGKYWLVAGTWFDIAMKTEHIFATQQHSAATIDGTLTSEQI